MDWDDDDILPRKGVEPLRVARRYICPIHLQRDQRVIAGQQHAVIELITDLAHQAFDRDEVEDVVILVGLTYETDRGAIVMAVQGFAQTAIIRNKVSRTEPEIILRHVDFKLGQTATPANADQSFIDNNVGPLITATGRSFAHRTA